MLGAFGVLEWSFVIALVVLVGLASLFGGYVVMNLFRIPQRHPHRRGLRR